MTYPVDSYRSTFGPKLDAEEAISASKRHKPAQQTTVSSELATRTLCQSTIPPTQDLSDDTREWSYTSPDPSTPGLRICPVVDPDFLLSPAICARPPSIQDFSDDTRKWSYTSPDPSTPGLRICSVVDPDFLPGPAICARPPSIQDFSDDTRKWSYTSPDPSTPGLRICPVVVPNFLKRTRDEFSSAPPQLKPVGTINQPCAQHKQDYYESPLGANSATSFPNKNEECFVKQGVVKSGVINVANCHAENLPSRSVRDFQILLSSMCERLEDPILSNTTICCRTDISCRLLLSQSSSDICICTDKEKEYHSKGKKVVVAYPLKDVTLAQLLEIRARLFQACSLMEITLHWIGKYCEPILPSDVLYSYGGDSIQEPIKS